LNAGVNALQRRGVLYSFMVEEWHRITHSCKSYSYSIDEGDALMTQTPPIMSLPTLLPGGFSYNMSFGEIRNIQAIAWPWRNIRGIGFK
jgi:hypothetical protein